MKPQINPMWLICSACGKRFRYHVTIGLMRHGRQWYGSCEDLHCRADLVPDEERNRREEGREGR